MKKNNIFNLHLTLTDFKNESRILKQTDSLINSGIIDEVDIISLHNEELLFYEILSNKIKLYRLRLVTKKLPKNLFFQLLKYTEFLFKVMFISKNRKYKIITIHSLSLLPIGCFLKLIYGHKLVYDAHELETETFVLKGFKKVLAKFVEKLFITYVDLVVVVSDSIATWYRNSYSNVRVITVKNSPRFVNVTKSNLLRKRLSIPKNKKILLYLGGLVEGRGVEDLLDIFSNMKSTEYVLVFMGYGCLYHHIINSPEYCDTIFYMPAVKPSEVLDYASSADFGIAYIDNGSLNDKYCLPNKFFEYIFSNLPVIVNDSPEMATIVKKYSIGLVLDKLSMAELLNALTIISNMDSKILYSNLKNASNNLSWDVQEIELINGYQALI